MLTVINFSQLSVQLKVNVGANQNSNVLNYTDVNMKINSKVFNDIYEKIRKYKAR